MRSQCATRPHPTSRIRQPFRPPLHKGCLGNGLLCVRSDFVPSTSPSDALVIMLSTTAFDGSKQAPTARVSPHWLFCKAHQHFKISHRAGSKLDGIGVDCVFLKNDAYHFHEFRKYALGKFTENRTTSFPLSPGNAIIVTNAKSPRTAALGRFIRTIGRPTTKRY